MPEKELNLSLEDIDLEGLAAALEENAKRNKGRGSGGFEAGRGTGYPVFFQPEEQGSFGTSTGPSIGNDMKSIDLSEIVLDPKMFPNPTKSKR